ncbi:MAG: DUF4168 domain-containing protein [Okeania sp. SIO2F4]|uniref:DUF4168 domain-containing protein n=1 Tax=Okeania sp. SIO2F4 TaxID=2607790 RepID=UPI00142BB258|nr:DUF4168 domain-containing protein [Okeania sp. SIO2F4]MDJ0516822.1 DUF4168 domain-containing protein [Trichodesmium sp. MO_231.B1]NES04036.1 DUF4168 domain-containing protein [Okeania sp. SIO2F4]
MNIKALVCNIQLCPQRLISRSLFVVTLSTLGLMMGIIPRVSNPSLNPIFDTPAYAQESFTDQAVTAEEITKYAVSVLQIENLRIGVYREIQNEFQKQSPGGSVPPIICNQKSSVNTLPQNIQVIAVSYCNQAKKIIEGNDLTVSRFNRITMTQKTDPTLREKIQTELIRIQQQTGN